MKIIVFEGIDGTGKSVQLEILAQRLEGMGLRVSQMSFPMYDTFFGARVGHYLTGKDELRADAVDGKSMGLWFALDRWSAFQHFDRASCDVLLINRYVLSNAVYQSIRDCDAGKPEILDFILELEYEQFGIPRPDMQLVLDMDTQDAASNVGKKGFRDYVGNEKDVYELGGSIQQRARKKYRALAEKLPNMKLIPCMADGKLKSIEDISVLIWEAAKCLTAMNNEE